MTGLGYWKEIHRMEKSEREIIMGSRKYRNLLANEARAYKSYVKWANAFGRANAGKSPGEAELVSDTFGREEFSGYYRNYAIYLAKNGGRYSGKRFVVAFNTRLNHTQLDAMAEFFTTNTDFGERYIGKSTRYRTGFDASWLGKSKDEFIRDFLDMDDGGRRKLMTAYYAYEGSDIGYGNEKVLDGESFR